jgi:hypothetical protein
MKKIAIVLLLLLPLSIVAQVDRKEFRQNKEIRQEVNTLFNELYLQNSEISFVTFPYSQVGMNNYTVLTANLVPHYYVFPKQWRMGLTLTPQIRIRIWDDYSFPIRTPSFIPQATFFMKLNLNPNRYKYFSLKLAHHSNGQDGAPLNADSTINLVNGNFHTNYVEWAYNFGFQNSKGNSYYKLGIELHTGLLELLDEPAYRDKYGKIRVNFAMSGSKYVNIITEKMFRKILVDPTENKQELWRTVFEAMYIADKEVDIDWYQRFNAELKLYRKIRNSPNTAWFMSFGYLGHDYYNIYFLNSYPIVRFGLAAGNSFLYKNAQ